MATIKDVAKLAGVSICTVSRALANKENITPKTMEKVLSAVRELDYKPNYSARSLKIGSTDTLGLIVPDITNPYYPKVAKSIEEYAEKKGYMILLCNSNEDLNKEKRLVDTLKKRNVDGVIILPCSRHIEHFRGFDNAGIPYVFLNRSFKGTANCIPSDNFYGAYTVTKYVIGKGHRNICAAYLGFENQIYQERFQGTMEALREHGLEQCVKQFIFDIKDIQDSYMRIRKVLEGRDRPTALIAANDMLCFGAYSAASDCGLSIPGDFSVTGYDDISMASLMMPPLTSFRQPEDVMAKGGVDYLLECIAGNSPAPPARLRGELVVRQSVCDIRGDICL